MQTHNVSSVRDNKNQSYQQMKLQSNDSTVSFSVISKIDTSAEFDTHLISKNDVIYAQEVILEKNGKLIAIAWPQVDTSVDTVKNIAGKKYSFFSQIIQSIYLDEYNNSQIILTIKYAAFNNASGERYYYFTADGKYLGELDCVREICDTIGDPILWELDEPIMQDTRSLFDK
ncbi:MAG TPA: hypothetical protein PLL28_12445 [Chitinophagales bacterium]|nr:hypothetical protein [Chitinophagales bacterium]HNE47254.1 hypothetical protein [Chitinophagales bacterium]HNF70179.1 hypothetical protein [Chitinophagales bacterium]